MARDGGKGGGKGGGSGAAASSAAAAAGPSRLGKLLQNVNVAGTALFFRILLVRERGRDTHSRGPQGSSNGGIFAAPQA